MIKILIADDHPLIRTGIRSSLEEDEKISVIGEAGNGEETLQLCQELLPDIVLLDLNMPGPSPLVIVTTVKKHSPLIKIIILTAYDDEIYIRKLFDLGIDGYVLKEEVPEKLVHAINAVVAGDSWFSKRVIDLMMTPVNKEFNSAINNNNFIQRELEVLQQLIKGYSNNQIAEILAITEGTVKNHLMNIYQKIDIHSRAELISWIFNHEQNQPRYKFK